MKAFHRRKREVDSRTNSYTNLSRNNNEKVITEQKIRQNTRRSQKEAIDRRRRKFLEERKRRLEELRKDPTAYRRHQRKLRMEGRRMHSASKSDSSSVSRSASVESSKSQEQFIQTARNHTQHKNWSQRRNSNEQRRQRMRARQRRRRRSTNCATIEPKYQWEAKNFKSKSEEFKQNRYYKVTMNFFLYIWESFAISNISSTDLIAYFLIEHIFSSVNEDQGPSLLIYHFWQ